MHDYAHHIEQQLTGPSILIGWSLGGLISQCLASTLSSKLIAQVQIASSPKFLQDQNWLGIKPRVLQNFHEQLQIDQASLIKRFIAIQCMGLKNAKETIKLITDLVKQYPQSQSQNLKTSLAILTNTDLRNELKQTKVPSLRIYGRLDSLVPAGILSPVESMCPQTQSVLMQKASHAPFISHPQETSELITNFVLALKFSQT